MEQVSMRIISLIIVVIILGLCITFASLNASSTTVNYLFGEKELPLIAVMFVSLILGVLLSFFAMIWKVLRLKAKIHSLNSKLKKSEHSHKSSEVALKEM